MPIFVKFVEADRSAVISDEKAVTALAKAAKRDDGTPGGQVEDVLIACQRKEVCPFAIGIVEQAVGEAFLPGEGVGIEDVEFFAPIAINIAGGDADCLTFGVSNHGGSDIAEVAAI